MYTRRELLKLAMVVLTSADLNVVWSGAVKTWCEILKVIVNEIRHIPYFRVSLVVVVEKDQLAQSRIRRQCTRQTVMT